jgi:hypothetical protein
MALPSRPLSDYVTTDTRILQAALLVAVIGTLGRLFDPSLNTALYAGLLAGVVNAPRTDEWEFAVKFAGVPAVLGSLAMALVLTVGIPLGFYSFPIETGVGWHSLFDVLGPLFEAHLFVPLYFFEGVIAFTLLKRVPGIAPEETA